MLSILDMYSVSYDRHRPISTRIKLLKILWLFCTMHITVLYSGKLFAMVAIDVEDKSVNTLDDVLNSQLRLV